MNPFLVKIKPKPKCLNIILNIQPLNASPKVMKVHLQSLR